MNVSFFGLKIVKKKDYDSLLWDKKNFCNLNQDLNDQISKLRGQYEESQKQKALAVREMKEYHELAQSYLDDQRKAEEQYAELSRLVQTTIKNGNNLSKLEKNLIYEDMIPKVCSIPYKDKINYGSAHSYPRGSEDFVEKVAQCPYVSKVRRGKFTRKVGRTTIKKTSSENNGYHLQAIYVGNNSRGVFVEITTTAKDELQYSFVHALLNKMFEVD